ncbi:hypothetical protein KFE25_004553 [Diacronema lutheri]|uniref:Uncharacterized protein n=2 Tax=Diacronema lutheri TaxID=2081491 RepID=A0A8J5X8J0_DIALT|nr:hypothetical protein KFE25_004553 [Diacronema lutheri]
MALACSLVAVAVVVTAPGISNPAPQRPKPPSAAPRRAAEPAAPRAGPPPRQQPDERQAAALRAMGYAWDGKRWGRGDLTSRERARASARSGNRFARLVDGDASAHAPSRSAAALAAVSRFEALLQAAREGALSSNEASRAANLRVKELVAHPLAPAGWLCAQLGTIGALANAAGVDVAAELARGATPLALGAGVVAGGAVAACRAAGRAVQPGVEEPDGALERLLADAAEGAHALPTPAHFRFESAGWRARALGAELVAAVTATLALQACVQAACLGTGVANALAWRLVDASDGSELAQHAALLGPAAAALLAALPAAARGALHAAPPLDGIDAECAAAARAKRGAASYFSMCPPRDGGEPDDAAAALCALADGWLSKFERPAAASPAVGAQAASAFGASLACALAWQLSGGALAAPFLARAIAALDAYALRPNAEAARATIILPAAIAAPRALDEA